MTSGENKNNFYSFNKTGAVFDRMWKRTIDSMASYNAILATPKDNPMPISRNFRSVKPKVGREFFEHDTRNNSEFFSYANSIRSDQKTTMYIDRCITKNKCEETNISKSIEKSLERRYDESKEPSSPSIESNSTKSHHETESNVIPTYRSFVSKNHYHGFNYQSKFNSNQLNNKKLKKKLFKIQRQLRLQTVALRRQRIAGNWCCSCACSSSKHGQIQNQFKRFDHRYNGAEGSECKFVVCDNKMMKGGVLRQPIHLQGLRSVVR